MARLGASAARAFHRRVFVPGAAIVFASGDVDPEALLARIRATYGAWQGPPPPDVGAPAAGPPQQRRVVVVDRPDLGQAQIGVGHGGIARSDPRRLAVQLLNTALGGGGFSSRLMARIRARGRASPTGSARSSCSAIARGRSRSSPSRACPKVGEVLTGILEELERVRREPPSADELARVQSQRAGQFALALETSAEVVAALVDLEVYGLPPDTLDTYRGRVRAVTVDETSAVARELIDPARASIVVVGPAEQLRAAARALRRRRGGAALTA